MTEQEMKDLKTGDIVRGRFSKVSYVVTGNYGDHITAVCTADITHAEEWDLVEKHQGEQR